MTKDSKFRVEDAFTLIELIIVIGIIIVLAGLILATSGYVTKKGQRSRAEAEIAALSAALESYKADNGIYPRDTATDSLDAKLIYTPTSYQGASGDLYAQLIGDADYNDITDAGAKTYMSFKPNMKGLPDKSQPPSAANKTFIQDPFGNSYGYSTANQASTSTGYNPTFDLWSTAGGKAASDVPGWIKNW
jgi:type II secretory pathway pseudopilin PulG